MRDRHTGAEAGNHCGEGWKFIGRKIADKFAKFGLNKAPAKCVTPPLIANCFANLECKVIDTGFVTKYCLFVLEVVQAWVDPAQKNPKTIHHHGYGRFVVDGETIKLKSRMRLPENIRWRPHCCCAQ